MKHFPCALRTVLLVSVIAITGLSACKQPTSGLFYTIENEAVITNNKNGLEKDVSVTRVVAVTDADPAFPNKTKLFAIAGNILFSSYTGATTPSGVLGSSNRWFSENRPDQTHLTCVDIAAAGSTLYAIFAANATVSSDGTPLLFQATLIDGILVWSAVTAPAGQTPQGLRSNAGRIFLLSSWYPSGYTSQLYKLYTLSGAAVGPEVIGYTNNYLPLAEMAGPANQTLAITADTIYRTDLSAAVPVFVATAKPVAPSASRTVLTSVAWGLVPNSNTALPPVSTYFLSSLTGWLAKSSDFGATWTTSATTMNNASNTMYKFTSLVYLSGLKDFSTSGVLPDTLLAASSGQGLARVDVSSMAALGQPSLLSSDLLWSGDYTSANSSLSYTRRFQPYAAGNRVFVGSYNKGLWSFVYDSQRVGSNTIKSGLFFTWE